MCPTSSRVTLGTRFLFINHSQYGISNVNLSRCNRGLEEAANMTIIKITWLATCVSAFLKRRHRIFNPLVLGTFQPLQDGCETGTLWNESQEQTFLRRLLTVLREKILPLCRNLLSPFLGSNNGSFEKLEPPYQATGLHTAENIDNQKKNALQKMRNSHLKGMVRTVYGDYVYALHIYPEFYVGKHPTL